MTAQGMVTCDPNGNGPAVLSMAGQNDPVRTPCVLPCVVAKVTDALGAATRQARWLRLLTGRCRKRHEVQVLAAPFMNTRCSTRQRRVALEEGVCRAGYALRESQRQRRVGRAYHSIQPAPPTAKINAGRSCHGSLDPCRGKCGEATGGGDRAGTVGSRSRPARYGQAAVTQIATVTRTITRHPQPPREVAE